ncbi:unnamed protein product [Ectocarpus sp. 6 AP-2014]
MERSHNMLEGGANTPLTSETRRVTRKLTRNFSWSGRARGRWTTSSKASLGAEELEVLVMGTSELDFEKLAKATEYDGGYGKDHRTVLAFWRAVGRMPAEEQRHLLMFVTGSKKAPLGGLDPAGEIGLGPASLGPHVLQQTEYSGEKTLTRLLKRAITECEGFGLR